MKVIRKPFPLNLMLLLSVLLLWNGALLRAQFSSQDAYTIDWQQPDTLIFDGYDALVRMHFEGAEYQDMLSATPHFVTIIPLFDTEVEAKISISNPVTEAVPERETSLLKQALAKDFEIRTSMLISRGTPQLRVELVPLRQTDDLIERLVSFTLETTILPKGKNPEVNRSFASSSVLASGDWYKFRIAKTGIHIMTAADLQQAGISVGSINPKHISIYGNGGGVLPESNLSPRLDDLTEMPIEVVGESDGIFNDNDYIIFYAEGPVAWRYNELKGIYDYQNNPYDDYSHVFLTIGNQDGKRMGNEETFSGSITETITDFIDYKVEEQDLYNLTNTGRTYYGDVFDVTTNRNYPFDFSNIITSKEAYLRTEVASRNFDGASFSVSIDGVVQRTLSIGATSATGYDFARQNSAEITFNPSGNTVNVDLKFNRASNSARGWLDYIMVNVWRQLAYENAQFPFRNNRYAGEDDIYSYRLSNAPASLKIWDVTEAANPHALAVNMQAGTAVVQAKADQPREFIAFDGSSYFPVEFVAKVENQNLHAVRDVDYLIVSHPDFLEQAERLANIHREKSGLQVFVTTPDLIYNEFSSGSADITAIRDFARMLYAESTPGRQLRYLLLFGDASFDYKNRDGVVSSYVPTWESVESLNLVTSIASDDYFGYLDLNEGGTDSNLLDIGIGRFPVDSPLQAAQMVDKVEDYLTRNDKTMGPWRNFITFISDDGDGNLHLSDAEKLYRFLDTTQRVMNIDKIYLDAYKQVATPGGQKAPEVNDAINKRIDKGSLIMNYSGHGGEVGWSEERILEIADINSWRNIEKLPVFITATCEFSRYDDHTRTSAGELVFLNPEGGAIAMFTTARATYASANLSLNMAIYNNNIFKKENGEYPRFGDIIRRSKLTGNANDRKFVLLGDPALQLANPRLLVETTQINGSPVNGTSDTLRALEVVTIEGRITDTDGMPVDDFNGVLYPSVYDKSSQITTLGDQNPSTSFTLRNSVIYKGKVGVVNGRFSFSFMLPKDIAYRYGKGRISYYATNYETDAHGYYEDIDIGGFNENATEDTQGPTIKLFINDTSFVNGGFTNETPTLIAYVSDENGINTTGAGIGHDITATVNGASTMTAILNDYYEAELNRTAAGMISYPISKLNPGTHTLTFKIWDVFNNSSVATIDFEVIGSNEMVVENLMNYPNPFTDETFFVFNHNQSGYQLDIQIEIYSINGQLVRKLEGNTAGSLTRSEPLRWDGTTSSGQKLPKGLYIYRLIATNESGQQTDKRAKLIIYR